MFDEDEPTGGGRGKILTEGRLNEWTEELHPEPLGANRSRAGLEAPKRVKEEDWSGLPAKNHLAAAKFRRYQHPDWIIQHSRDDTYVFCKRSLKKNRDGERFHLPVVIPGETLVVRDTQAKKEASFEVVSVGHAKKQRATFFVEMRKEGAP